MFKIKNNCPQNNPGRLLTKKEIINYVNSLGFKFNDTKFRYYIREKILPKGVIIKGKGNVKYFNRDLFRVILNAVSFYELQGYKLKEINKKIKNFLNFKGKTLVLNDETITGSYKFFLRDMISDNLDKLININLSCYENMLIHLQAARQNDFARSERNYRMLKRLYNSNLPEKEILYRRLLFRFKYDMALVNEYSLRHAECGLEKECRRCQYRKTCGYGELYSCWNKVLIEVEKLTLWKFAEKYSLVMYSKIKPDQIVDPQHKIIPPRTFRCLRTELKSRYLEHVHFMREEIRS